MTVSIPTNARYCGDPLKRLQTDSDYTIFVWRRQQQDDEHSHHTKAPEPDLLPVASSSKTTLPVAPAMNGNRSTMASTPTLHLHNPKKPLPASPAYCNPSYYVFHSPPRAHTPAGSRKSPVPSRASTSRRSKKGKNGSFEEESGDDGVPKFKKQFDRFHSENGVRTVMGSIGPVQNGEYFRSIDAHILTLGLHCTCSPYASQIGLSTCIHFSQVCSEARVHTA